MDKSLNKFLIALFGVSGIAIVLLAWLRPMPEMERAITTLFGIAGIAVASWQSMKIRNHAESVTVKNNNDEDFHNEEVRG